MCSLQKEKYLAPHDKWHLVDEFRCSTWCILHSPYRRGPRTNAYRAAPQAQSCSTSFPYRLWRLDPNFRWAPDWHWYVGLKRKQPRFVTPITRCEITLSGNVNLLCTWQRPMANWESSGTCLRISSVTRCTPLCCGLKLIFFWNQAELLWIILAEEAMFDLLSLSVASLNVYFYNTHKQSRRSNTTKTLLVITSFIIIMSKTSGTLVYNSSRRKLKRLQETCRSVSGSFLTLRSDSGKFERARPPTAKFKIHTNNIYSLDQKYIIITAVY